MCLKSIIIWFCIYAFLFCDIPFFNEKKKKTGEKKEVQAMAKIGDWQIN